MTLRTYRDVTGPDASGILEQVTEQRERVRARLAAVRRVVAVMSGKGGVGKSYLTAAIARAAGERWPGGVGVIDADLKSPTVARVLGASGPLRLTDAGVEPARDPAGVRVISTEFLLATGRPLGWREPGAEQFVWRGALEAGVLREFLSDVIWGPLELLLVDLPPGADGVADLKALVPELTGAIAVTIPTDESERSVARALAAARDAEIPLLGVIENMAGARASDGTEMGALFSGDAGRALAQAFSIPLLAHVPFAMPGPGAGAADALDAAARARVLEALR